MSQTVEQVVQPCPLHQSDVVVSVVQDDTSAALGEFQVTLSGQSSQGPIPTTGGGFANFGRIAAGTYTVKVAASLAKKDELVVAEGQFTTTGGHPYLDERRATGLVTVTPKLAAEFTTVLLEPGLHAHQESTETKVKAHATYVKVWVEQDGASPKYSKGATLSVTGTGRVDVYSDSALSVKVDLTTPLTNAQLTGADKLELYLVGTTAGSFTLALTAEDPAAPGLKLAATPASLDMGVLALGLKLHQWDAANPPAPAEMTAEERVKQGRLLHAQATKNNGRAKLELSQITADKWPAGSDGYEVVLNATNASGEVEVWSAETDGALRALPLKLPKADLEAAPVTLWVEGKTATTDFRHVRLDLGIDRPTAGLAHTPKRNGNWARFTVIQIEKVAPKSQWDTPSDAYTNDRLRLYINLADDGRECTVKAKLSQKLKGVKLHFMLAPDKDNGKAANYGKDVPAVLKRASSPTDTWIWDDINAAAKHVDKADPGHVWHKSAVTDAEGEAECVLKLSQIGRDVFRGGVYCDQDPHLAGYKDGDVTHGARKPVLSKKLIVWRKLWYQLSKGKGTVVDAAADAVAAYAAVGVDLIKSPSYVLDTKQLPMEARNGTLYPEWMVSQGGGDEKVAVVGGHNWKPIRDGEATFFPAQKGEVRALKAHILVCAHQWDPAGWSALKQVRVTKNPTEWIEMSGNVVSPPLSGGLVLGRDPTNRSVLATGWKIMGRGGEIAAGGQLTEKDIEIAKDRPGTKYVRVNLPTAAASRLRDGVFVMLTLGVANNYLGESKGRHILAVFDPSDPADFQNTVIHEIGHSLHQTPKPPAQPTGMPDHPYWNEGMGTHCSYPEVPTNRGDPTIDQDPEYSNGAPSSTWAACVMYSTGAVPLAGHRFCQVCHHYLLPEAMRTLG